MSHIEALVGLPDEGRSHRQKWSVAMSTRDPQISSPTFQSDGKSGRRAAYQARQQRAETPDVEYVAAGASLPAGLIRGVSTAGKRFE
jgi:hypothetical protein